MKWIRFLAKEKWLWWDSNKMQIPIIATNQN